MVNHPPSAICDLVLSATFNPHPSSSILSTIEKYFYINHIQERGRILYIRWHGHACFEISDENITLVTDPHDGKSIGIKPPIVKADIVLVSHDHFDHNSIRTVEGPNTEVIHSRPEGEPVSGIEIRSYQTYHDDMEGEKRGVNNIFNFIMKGIRFCHLGDLGHVIDDRTAEMLKPIDILFIPVFSLLIT